MADAFRLPLLRIQILLPLALASVRAGVSVPGKVLSTATWLPVPAVVVRLRLLTAVSMAFAGPTRTDLPPVVTSPILPAAVAFHVKAVTLLSFVAEVFASVMLPAVAVAVTTPPASLIRPSLMLPPAVSPMAVPAAVYTVPSDIEISPVVAVAVMVPAPEVVTIPVALLVMPVCPIRVIFPPAALIAWLTFSVPVVSTILMSPAPPLVTPVMPLRVVTVTPEALVLLIDTKPPA